MPLWPLLSLAYFFSLASLLQVAYSRAALASYILIWQSLQLHLGVSVTWITNPDLFFQPQTRVSGFTLDIFDPSISRYLKHVQNETPYLLLHPCLSLLSCVRFSFWHYCNIVISDGHHSRFTCLASFGAYTPFSGYDFLPGSLDEKPESHFSFFPLLYSHV